LEQLSQNLFSEIINLDRDLFLFLNSTNSIFFDEVMWIVSQKESWFPFYIFIILYSFIKLSSKNFRIFFFSILISVGLSDFVTSGIMKPTFERLRPSHDKTLSVHLVKNYHGGNYGFASSHASNSFAIATILFLFFRWKLIFIWAFFVSYSRIYLGVHFPLDIFVGGIIGVFISFQTVKIFLKKE
jgi:undecaprenyl-diphosphatase